MARRKKTTVESVVEVEEALKAPQQEIAKVETEVFFEVHRGDELILSSETLKDGKAVQIVEE